MPTRRTRCLLFDADLRFGRVPSRTSRSLGKIHGLVLCRHRETATNTSSSRKHLHLLGAAPRSSCGGALFRVSARNTPGTPHTDTGRRLTGPADAPPPPGCKSTVLLELGSSSSSRTRFVSTRFTVCAYARLPQLTAAVTDGVEGACAAAGSVSRCVALYSFLRSARRCGTAASVPSTNPRHLSTSAAALEASASPRLTPAPPRAHTTHCHPVRGVCPPQHIEVSVYSCACRGTPARPAASHRSLVT